MSRSESQGAFELEGSSQPSSEPAGAAKEAEPEGDWLSALLERLPTLGDIRLPFTSRRIPFQAGLTPAECGVACLAMVLRHYRRWASLEEVMAHLESLRAKRAKVRDPPAGS